MRACTFALLVLAVAAPAQRHRRLVPKDSEHIKLVRIQSPRLTKHWGRPMFLEAGVVVPTNRKASKKLPVCYNIHGFGGSHRAAWGRGKRVLQKMSLDDYPRMIYVYLNAACPRGHHEFADSANNGPVGTALIHELIPAIEKRFNADGTANGRFLTGHSSGGWSSFWLQVTYPDFFGGTWSTAPDSTDFRDFTGINIYAFKNAYVDPKGEPIQLMRRNGKWVRTIKQFAQGEVARQPFGGQFSSFDYVFSPRGADGLPLPLFDRDTGKIDHAVARAWQKYDIGLILKRNWHTIGSKLWGKLCIYVGTLDTFRLEGPSKLLKKDLADLGSNAEIILVEGRDHGSLMRPHKRLWPDGMMHRIHHEMRARWERGR